MNPPVRVWRVTAAHVCGDRLGRQVLEHRDRVDAVEPLAGGEIVGKDAADDADLRVGAPQRFETGRPAVPAVVGVDHGDVVAEPEEPRRDERLAGTDLEQLGAGRDGRDDRLEDPRSLRVLQIAGDHEVGEVIGRVAVVTDGRVAEPGRAMVAVVLDGARPKTSR